MIKRVDHDKTVREGHSANIFAVAKAVGTSGAWVEHCMEVYGRHPAHSNVESGESERETRLEELEENEPEETLSEDVESPGEREQPAKEKHPERQPVVRARPTPRERLE